MCDSFLPYDLILPGDELTQSVLAIRDGLANVRLAFIGRDQAAQTADIRAPAIWTDSVALILGNESMMREVDLRFVLFFGDFKTDLRVRPLGFVLCEIEVVIQHMPDDFLIRDELYDS